MKFAKMLVLMLLVVMVSGFASAVNLDVDYVRINGEIYEDVDATSDNIKVERGEEVELSIKVKALSDVENAQVEADIYGYRYSYAEGEKVSATSKTFDLDENDTDIIDLDLMIPTDIDKKYTVVRVRVGDENSQSFEQRYQLHVVGIEDDQAVQINDYSFSPSTSINAGRAFTSTVKVENIGDDDLDDVKVTVSIPQLNIQDSEYLDELDADEKETLEEFLLRIPDCAEPGNYDVKIEVEFDKYHSTTQHATISVLEGDACSENAYGEEKTTVTVTESKTGDAGKQIEFPLIVTNLGETTKIYSMAVTGVQSWAEMSMSPGSQVVVEAGQTKIANLYITPDEDVAGEKMFIVTITNNGDTKTIPLTLNVQGAETGDEVEPATGSNDFRNTLEIALFVLVIILIIVGLIIGFNKMRKKDDEDETQTYY